MDQQFTLPKRYDFHTIEDKWQKFWESNNVYTFDPDSTAPVFSVDTPPPTVSGNLHIGHIFSYTQAEAIVRYFRMKGYNVLYPMGFDDNGLPSERLTEKEHKVKGSHMDRTDFINLCLKTTRKYVTKFATLWKKLGFSIEWNRVYSTIDETSRRISQRSFIELYNQGKIYRKEAPALFCTECHTSFAQAEIESKDLSSKFYDILFKDAANQDIVIATTRPELLPACVAVFVHPDDGRYRHLVGRELIVPLFQQKVTVYADHKVDMEKGTGIVMCCTFGDKTDIEWWQHFHLPLKQAISETGTMTELAGRYQGMPIFKARKAIVADLTDQGLLRGSRDILHPVGTHERCGTPVEFLMVPQWFIRVLDMKDKLIEACHKVEWYPDYMKHRFINWVENLEWDWCISRQRFFGVPFPLWYCAQCGAVALADVDSLPVDPTSAQPKNPCKACGANDFVPESDVLDTWATSSMTPEIVVRWRESDDLSPKVWPLTLRPQAHEIIRTWAFYTMVKSLYHFDCIPWQKAMISGFVVAEQKSRQKISKSKGNAPATPEQVLAQHGADSLRYWSLSAKLGSDYTFNQQDLKTAKRLLTKLWNASRFALGFLKDYAKAPWDQQLEIVDRWIFTKLAYTVRKVDEYLQQFEFGIAKTEIEKFFWQAFCDNYIELVKVRLYHAEEHGETARQSGLYTLYRVMLAVLKLFAPFLPHITEEIYHSYFKAQENVISLHLCRFPYWDEFQVDEEAFAQGEAVVAVLGAIRKYRTEQKMSIKEGLYRVVIHTPIALTHPGLIRDIKHHGNVSVLDVVHDEEAQEVSAQVIEPQKLA